MQFHLLYYRNRTGSNISDAKWIINFLNWSSVWYKKNAYNWMGKAKLLKKKKTLVPFYCVSRIKQMWFREEWPYQNFRTSICLNLHQVCISQRRTEVFSRLWSPTLKTHLTSVRGPEGRHATAVKLHLPQIIWRETVWYTTCWWVQWRLHKLNAAASETMSQAKWSLLGTRNCWTQWHLNSSIP